MALFLDRKENCTNCLIVYIKILKENNDYIIDDDGIIFILKTKNNRNDDF